MAIAMGAILVLGSATAAAATGVAVDASHLPVAARASLTTQVNAWRTTHPGAFAALRGVQGCSREGYRSARNPVPNCSREMRALGAGVLLPMLEALALAEPAGLADSDEEKTALANAMLQAVGILRDRRATPILVAVFEHGHRRALSGTAREAALALGRLGDEEAFAVLAKHTATGDPRRLAAIAGLGQSRRLDGAQHLAALGTSERDAGALVAIAHALGIAASSWAWQAMGSDAADLGLAVRTTAAKALVDLFVRHAGDVRVQAGKSLLMAEHKDTRELLLGARRKVDATTAAEIDAYLGQHGKRFTGR